MASQQNEVVQVLSYSPFEGLLETHLEVAVTYVTADKHIRRTRNIIAFSEYAAAEEVLAAALDHQTSYIQEHWLRMEVSVPNQDKYGKLHPELAQDTNMLLATRHLH